MINDFESKKRFVRRVIASMKNQRTEVEIERDARLTDDDPNGKYNHYLKPTLLFRDGWWVCQVGKFTKRAFTIEGLLYELHQEKWI